MDQRSTAAKRLVKGSCVDGSAIYGISEVSQSSIYGSEIDAAQRIDAGSFFFESKCSLFNALLYHKHKLNSKKFNNIEHFNRSARIFVDLSLKLEFKTKP